MSSAELQRAFAALTGLSSCPRCAGVRTIATGRLKRDVAPCPSCCRPAQLPRVRRVCARAVRVASSSEPETFAAWCTCWTRGSGTHLPPCAGALPPAVTYTREPHAAHYAGLPGRGHDLEGYTYAQPTRLPVPAGVPSDAEYHHGFVESGVQRWTYVRRAPLSDVECAVCARGRRAS